MIFHIPLFLYPIAIFQLLSYVLTQTWSSLPINQSLRAQNPIFCNHLAYDVFDASDTVSIRTVNRQCSSSLQAVADVAAAIKVGYYDIGEDF